MKEIKFRTWDRKRNKMIPDSHEEQEMDTTLLFFNGDKDVENRYAHMQYVNFKDKNGTEIYEDDVITHPVMGKMLVEIENFLYWKNELSMQEEDVEILGNINEKRNLLRQ